MGGGEVKAYEKACKQSVEGGWGTPHSGLAEYVCPECHGTGVVPMTTDEMLEALRSLLESARPGRSVPILMPFNGGWYCITDAPEGCVISESEIYATKGWICETPDDALRAALESVSE
jgi:hypothetical protein